MLLVAHDQDAHKHRNGSFFLPQQFADKVRTLERKELRLEVESSGFHELVSSGSLAQSTLGNLRLAWDNTAEELVQVWAAERWLSTERPDSLELCAMGTRSTTLEAELMWMNGVLRPNNTLRDLFAEPFPGEVRRPLSDDAKTELAALELRVSSLRERFPYAF